MHIGNTVVINAAIFIQLGLKDVISITLPLIVRRQSIPPALGFE